MDEILSKSEVKRRFKAIEQMVQELAELSDRDLARLPCDENLRRELRDTRKLKGGSRNRQIKFIAKILRQEDPGELFGFLESRKGSQLKKNREFHDLEYLRDAIINEAIVFYDQAVKEDGQWDEPVWQGEVVDGAALRFPDLDMADVKKSAWYFARTRKPQYSREIFRMLKAAKERLEFRQAKMKDSDPGTEDVADITA